MPISFYRNFTRILLRVINMEPWDNDPDKPDKNNDIPLDKFGNIDMERLQELVNELIQNMGGASGINPELFEKVIREGMGSLKPFIMGFSASPGQDGKIHLRPFGNINSNKDGSIKLKQHREPLIDIVEKPTSIIVIAELPGVTREDIKISTNKQKLRIKVDNPDRKYYKEIDLPREILPDSAVARYNNGVLELTLDTVPNDSESHNIPVQ